LSVSVSPFKCPASATQPTWKGFALPGCQTDAKGRENHDYCCRRRGNRANQVNRASQGNRVEFRPAPSASDSASKLGRDARSASPPAGEAGDLPGATRWWPGNRWPPDHFGRRLEADAGQYALHALKAGGGEETRISRSGSGGPDYWASVLPGRLCRLPAPGAGRSSGVETRC